jgi:predicted Zn-dependent protease with MMP-like domain/uncharacterized protein (DUF952 family)
VAHTTNNLAFHLAPADDWARTSPSDPFRAESLLTEGFIHLTHAMPDLVDVANSLYRDDPRAHVVLTVDLERLTSMWRYDGDERFPHVYGPLDAQAITEVRPMPRRDDGTFLPIDAPDGIDGLFDQAIDRVLRTLPAPFVEQLGSVAIVVEDEATPDQLASVRAQGLFGLYQGVPRTHWGADNAATTSKITLFRGPLVRANPGRDRLLAAVEATLIHEIAHHLGISDDRLHELRRG